MHKCVAEVERFIEEQKHAGKADNTVKTYERIMNAFVDWLEHNGGDLQELTRYDVQAYIKGLENGGKSASTVDKIFACLSVYARFVGRPDAVDRIRRTRPQKKRETAPKSLEDLDRKRLLRDIEKAGNNRDIAIVYVLLQTGVRVSELCALDRSDIQINERSGNLTVRTSKGGRDRSIALSVDVRHHLSRYMETRTDEDPALFLSNEKKRISARAVQHMLGKYGTHPHALRHTFVRSLVKAGNDLSTVADLAGHADINMTRRYSKPSESEKAAAIDKAFS